MTCSHCHSHNVVQFAISPAGRPMHYSTCRGCEAGWWTNDHDNSLVPLDDVLALLDA